MARLARRSAGSRVAARAQRLADDLLIVEEQCFEEIAALVARGAVPARKAVRKSLTATDELASLASNAALARELQRLHINSTRRVFPVVRALFSSTADASVESMKDELGWCEATLGKKHRGLADAAVTFASGQVGELVEQAMDAFEPVAVEQAVVFGQESHKQMLLARQYEDTTDDLLARLFETEPVRRPGITGRGVWMRTASALNARTRLSSISLMNAVRVTAMMAFNEYGARRG